MIPIGKCGWMLMLLFTDRIDEQETRGGIGSSGDWQAAFGRLRPAAFGHDYGVVHDTTLFCCFDGTEEQPCRCLISGTILQ